MRLVNNIGNTGWFTDRFFRHGIAWIVIAILAVFYFNPDGITTIGIVYTLFTLLYLGIIVYFNINYLVPEYLGRNEFVKYLTLLVLSAFLISPIRTLTLYVLYIGEPEIQNEIVLSHWQIFIAMIIIGLISTIFKIIFDWFKSQREFRQLETENMQSELKFLRSQVNPHFLFNTLNSIYALTLKKSDKAPDTVIKLSEMMRYMLYECNDRHVPLVNEIKFIENYLELERIRHGDEVDIVFKYQGDPEDKTIAPLIFTPFLENAFKHGLYNEIDSSHVFIKLIIEENNIYFTIENSLPEELELPIQKPKTKKSGGIGLINIRRRLELLYPNRYTLNIKQKEKIYSVELTINL